MGVMGGHFLDVIPYRNEQFPLKLVPFIVIWFLFSCVLIAWIFVTFVIPEPRKPTLAEKKFRTLDKAGSVTEPELLPCWVDQSLEEETEARRAGAEVEIEKTIEPAEVFVTVVIPAYNEEKRLIGMLEETVNYLESTYSTSNVEGATANATPSSDGTPRRRQQSAKAPANGHLPSTPARGWEMLIIDDGSSDDTILVCETFCRTHLLPQRPRRESGPWSHRSETAVNVPAGSIRMVSLERNRGKGGAVTHGMRHARGQYVVFADADGASKFDDLGKLVQACQAIEDADGRGVAVGSRAHLVGSAAVVTRSRLRNFLMHSFHLLLKLMTPPKTARIKDTQCGFKLFSRPSLPWIVPYMHCEGWIFDVEMLMLAEFAGIPVAEVPVGWREVTGSKLNVLTDSIGMAWGLALLRFCWGVGIYRR